MSRIDLNPQIRQRLRHQQNLLPNVSSSIYSPLKSSSFSLLEFHIERSRILTKIIKESKVLIPKAQLTFNSGLKSLVFKNHQLIVKYLSSHSAELSYIPKHIKVSEIQSTSNSNSFNFKVEKGEEFQQKHLWQEGCSQILNFVECFIKGILELQRLFLFHPDLALRNIIRRKVADNQYIYQIIDWDFAFKVRSDKEDCPLFKSTKDIIRFLLKLKRLDYLAQYLFWQIKNVDNSIYDTLAAVFSSPLQQEPKILAIANSLDSYSLLFHKKEFKDLLWLTLDYRLNDKQWEEISRSIDDISVTNREHNSQGYFETLRKLKEIVKTIRKS